MDPWESIDYVSQWTKDERGKLDVSQSEIARRASLLWKSSGSSRELKQQHIDQLEKGQRKGVPDWFRFVRDAIQEMEYERLPAKVRLAAEHRPLPDLPPVVQDDVEMIREVDIRYAMGEGRTIDDFPEIGKMPFNRNMRRMLTMSPAEALFVARGDGDSMQPTLINDDAVLIDTAQNRINQSDRIWALRIEDAGLIKRVRIVPKVGYELISDNALIPPQVVARDDVVVVGRVIWVGRRV